MERLWYIRNGIFEEVRCEISGNVTSVNKNKIKCCSRKCAMSKVNPKTGLTGYEINTKKIKESNSKVDPETGLTGYQTSALKLSKSKLILSYTRKLNNFPVEYKLLTSEDDFVRGQYKLLKYQCNKCGSIRESYWAIYSMY